MRSTQRSAARRPWPRSAPGWPRAVCGSCSISRPITPRSIIPGSRRIPISTSRAASRPWRRRRRTTAGSRRTRAPASWPMGAIPNFPGWPDTLQLDYANPALQAAKTAELLAIAEQCDGVRCDMAMLVLPEIFRRTWGRAPAPFWPTAIAAVRRAHPGFTFLAEAYWDLEWDLQQQGFDYCYDKRLYDRLHNADAGALRAHLAAGLDYQDRLARFLENHDEPRAAASFPWPQHRAAATVTYFAPGLRFFHQGQLTGARVHVPVHLCRGPVEAPDPRCRCLLRQAAGGAERARHVSRRRLVVDPAATGLGRQCDVAGLHLLCLAHAGRRRPRRRRQLLGSSGAMPSAVALQRLGRPPVPADRHDGQRSLRPRRQRIDRSRASTSTSAPGAAMSSGWTPSGRERVSIAFVVSSASPERSRPSTAPLGVRSG